MANTVFRCLIPLTLIAVAGCSRGPAPSVQVVEVGGPSQAFCVQQGGVFEGGFCTLPDGRTVNAMTYYNSSVR